jgi:DNA-binding NtrC family response regulator
LVGGKEISSNFKLVCATHRNLEQMVADGKFREDLYMRISTLQIQVPSLAERKEDIPLIIESALPKWCRKNRIFIEFKDLPNDFIKFLTDTPIQGNIRGIEQQVSRLLILAPRDKNGLPILKSWKKILSINTSGKENNVSDKTGALTLEDILTRPLDIVGPTFPGLREFVEMVTARIFSEAKEKYDGRNNEIARVFKMSPASVSLKLRSYANQQESTSHRKVKGQKLNDPKPSESLGV